MPTYTYIGPVTAVSDTTNATRILLPNTTVDVAEDAWLLRLKAMGLLIANDDEPIEPEPNLTVLLLHFDGANGSTTFTDSSPNPVTGATTSGSPVISSTQSKFGSQSLYLDGASTLYIPNNAKYNVSTDVFTIECWIYLISLPTGISYILYNPPGAGGSQKVIGIHSSGELYVYLGGTDWFTSDASITANNWHHIAIVRAMADGDVFVYVNGVQKAQHQVSNSVDNQGDLGFGSWYGYGQYHGYIDEFRLRKEAVYTGNFTPPNAPFSY